MNYWTLMLWAGVHTPLVQQACKVPVPAEMFLKVADQEVPLTVALTSLMVPTFRVTFTGELAGLTIPEALKLRDDTVAPGAGVVMETESGMAFSLK